LTVLFPLIDAILVPQGPEYKAVCQGLSRVSVPIPPVLSIPVGALPLTRHLEKLQQAGHFLNYPQPRVLLVGLCGSLTPRYCVGDIVLYQSCVYQSSTATPKQRPCDPDLTVTLYHHLQERAILVKALTTNHLIYSAAEKRHLGQIYGADVVDMEGFAALEVLSRAGVAVAMLRVISDDSHHNIPDLSSALSPNGSLQSLPLAIGLMRQPIAAVRLIRGALGGLKVLRDVTSCLFAE
jgi:hypothetical protein